MRPGLQEYTNVFMGQLDANSGLLRAPFIKIRAGCQGERQIRTSQNLAFRAWAVITLLFTRKSAYHCRLATISRNFIVGMARRAGFRALAYQAWWVVVGFMMRITG